MVFVSDLEILFLEDGYVFVKIFVDDINYLFLKNKIDKEIVFYFVIDNFKLGL